MSSDSNSDLSYNPLENNNLYPNINKTNNINNNINNNKTDLKENTKQFFSKAFTSIGFWVKDVSSKVKTNIDKINNSKVEINPLENNNEPPIQISNLDEGLKILKNIEIKYQNQMSKNDILTLHAIIDFYRMYKKK